MSFNIPFDAQVEIIKRLPLKSLIQFRSVCKTWKSLIDSSRFLKHYSNQKQHLFVRYEELVDGKHEYVSVVDDDDTFPHHKVSLTVPMSIKRLTNAWIIGSSHGLICLYGTSFIDGLRKDVVALWNPSIRKAIDVVVPNVGGRIYESAIGFGVCRETTDPKIVKIRYVSNWPTGVVNVTSVPYQVEVFTLSTGTWRSPHGNLPRESIYFQSPEVVLDGVVYWFASDRIIKDGGLDCDLVVSFDMTSEEFREITLPCSLAQHPCIIPTLSKLKESLVALECDEVVTGGIIVWMMVDGDTKLFTKLFTIDLPAGDILVAGFRKSGEPIIEILEQEDDRGDDCAQLYVYEPHSKHIVNLGIYGISGSFSVHPYIETLLLLDQPDFMVYTR